MHLLQNNFLHFFPAGLYLHDTQQEEGYGFEQLEQLRTHSECSSPHLAPAVKEECI
jgi:hypothetical protein